MFICLNKSDFLQIVLFYNASSNAAGLKTFIADKQLKKQL